MGCRAMSGLWFFLLCLTSAAAEDLASYAEMPIFKITAEASRRLQGDHRIPFDSQAGCLDVPPLLEAHSNACIATEIQAVETCTRLANCVAVQCLPERAFTTAKLASLSASGSGIEEAASNADLREAAKRGDVYGIRRLLLQGSPKPADVDGGDAWRGLTPLMHAAAAGSFAGVEALIEAGASVLPVDKRGHDARDFAEEERLWDVEGGVDVNERSQRADIVAHLDVAAHRERQFRDRLPNKRHIASVREETLRYRAAVSKSSELRFRAKIAADAMARGEDSQRICFFHSGHAKLDTEEDDLECSKKKCLVLLLHVLPMAQALTLVTVPGGAARALWDAHSEKRTSVTFAADEQGDWTAAFVDVARGKARSAAADREKMIIDIIDGESLVKCAPNCPPRYVQDASFPLLQVDGSPLGAEAQNITLEILPGSPDYLDGIQASIDA